jgi:hypothetical protein
MTTQNRWLIAAAGVLMQIAFGAVCAWSVFRISLVASPRSSKFADIASALGGPSRR